MRLGEILIGRGQLAPDELDRALELQAGIDNYVGTLPLLSGQSPGRFPAELHDLLFNRCQVAPALAVERQALYRRASEHAARYCRGLEHRLRREVHRGGAWSRDLRAELRRWYRLPETRNRQTSAA